jgi:hypothetical protein
VVCSIGDGDKAFYTEWNEASESFDEMNLHENLLRGIYAYGTLCGGSCPFIAKL